MVPVRVHGRTRNRVLLGLVDTGADSTILPLALARDLGVKVKPCAGPPPTSFGGETLSLSYGNVAIELTDDQESYRWKTRVLFYDAPEGSEGTAILGHESFLDRFLATVDFRDGVMELIPNEWIEP
jgi:hypothetical protein